MRGHACEHAAQKPNGEIEKFASAIEAFNAWARLRLTTLKLSDRPGRDKGERRKEVRRPGLFAAAPG